MKFHIKSKKKYRILNEQIVQDNWPFEHLIDDDFIHNGQSITATNTTTTTTTTTNVITGDDRLKMPKSSSFNF